MTDQMCGCGRPLPHQGMCSAKYKLHIANGGTKPTGRAKRAEPAIRVEEVPPPASSSPDPKAPRGAEPPTEEEIAQGVREYDNYVTNDVVSYLDSKGPRKIPNLRELDTRALRIAGAISLTNAEAAVTQGLDPKTFERMLQHRDPQTGKRYRDILGEARHVGNASAKRRAWLQAQMMNAAGVQAMKLWAANNLGWSERRFEERVGKQEHLHLHAHQHKTIPSDSDLQKLTDQQLIEMSIDGAKH